MQKTRIQIYDKQRVKSSFGLLPDKHSSQEHLKRSNLQTYIWKQTVPYARHRLFHIRGQWLAANR